MEKWSAFLESLASRGGNLLVMIMFVGGMLSLLVMFLYHPASQASDRIIMVVLSTFSGFAGALLNTLVGSATHTATQAAAQAAKANGNGSTPPAPPAGTPGG